MLLVVFFGGYLAGHATVGPRGGFGTNQDVVPRQFGGNGSGSGDGGFPQLPGSGS